MHPIDEQIRKSGGYGMIALKGFCMGIADVIPGVSGGTIAFLFGIYEEFIGALKSFDLDFARRIFRGEVRGAFDSVAWRFLACLLSGIVAAVFTLAGTITWLLDQYYILTQSFFFGLVLATGPIIIRRLQSPSAGYVIPGLASAVAMFFFVGMVPVQTPDQVWFLFFAGMLAICAMVLPGISGAFILLLIGKYQVILQAVHERDFLIIAIVAAGCVAGILSFVRVLSWLLKHAHDLTLVILAGLVIGSLRKIWPWKEEISSVIVDGKVMTLEQTNILPGQYGSETLMAFVLILIGFVIGWGLNQEPERNGQ